MLDWGKIRGSSNPTIAMPQLHGSPVLRAPPHRSRAAASSVNIPRARRCRRIMCAVSFAPPPQHCGRPHWRCERQQRRTARCPRTSPVPSRMGTFGFCFVSTNDKARGYRQLIASTEGRPTPLLPWTTTTTATRRGWQTPSGARATGRRAPARIHAPIPK